MSRNWRVDYCRFLEVSRLFIFRRIVFWQRSDIGDKMIIKFTPSPDFAPSHKSNLNVLEKKQDRTASESSLDLENHGLELDYSLTIEIQQHSKVTSSQSLNT